MATAARDANVGDDGWWNALALGLPVAPPTTVPPDAIAVGHNGFDRDKVAAVSVKLQAPIGATIQTLKLSLKEQPATAANVGAAGAGVVACPATGPWEPVHNGAWVAAPTFDCELGKAQGKRGADGTWTFDLAGLGEQWLDSEFPLEQAGVVFHIEQSTTPVQVSFFGIKTGEFRLEFSATTPSEPKPAEPVVVGGLPAPAEPTPVSAPAAEPPVIDEGEPAVLVTQPVQTRNEAIADPNITGNLPWGAWLLVPIAIGTAAAVSYALGAGRSQGAKTRREGPVTRALSRQRQEG